MTLKFKNILKRLGGTFVKPIYSIGYSSTRFVDFLDILKKFRISTLIDIRTNPFSRFVPEYRKENLEKVLKQANIKYIFLGNLLGGKPENPSFYTPKGYWDYSAIIQSMDFKEGIETLFKLAERETIVLMCSEFDPAQCHRAIIIGRYLLSFHNIAINHLMGKWVQVDQREFEESLIFAHFSKMANQRSFFSNEELINQAYELQMKRIFKVKTK